MERISDPKTLASHLGPVMYAPDKIAALEKLGYTVEQSIESSIPDLLRSDALGAQGRLTAAAAGGPTVPITISTEPSPQLLGDGPRTVSGFEIVGTIFLSSIEEILKTLWEVLVYPQDVPASDVTRLFDLSLLRDTFTGIPDDATIGALLFPEPPKLHVVEADTLAMVQPAKLQLESAAGTVELVLTADLLFPIAIAVADGRIGLNTSAIVTQGKLSLGVDPSSIVQPRDAASLDNFASRITLGLFGAIGTVLHQRVRASAVITVPGFDDAKVKVAHIGVWLSRWNNRDLITLGAKIIPKDDTPPNEVPPSEALAPLANLNDPNTVSLMISESLVEQGLKALIDSGELSDRISEKLRWLSDYFTLPSRVDVTSGTVRFEEGLIRTKLRCSYRDVCALRTDFDFDAYVNLTPEVIDNQIRLRSDGIDINLDNTDTVWCLLTSVLTGPLGFILLNIGSVWAAVSSTSFNKKTPGFWQGNRLPNTDVFPRIDLTSVGRPSTGVLNAFGNWYLAPDLVSTFVVSQVLQLDEPSGEVRIVEGAQVELLELGSPAPQGDDYVIPPDFTGERTEDDGTVTRVQGTYRQTFSDQVVASGTTERHGLTHFAAALDDIGGVRDITETRYSPGGGGFTTRRQEMIGGDAPDLGVTVRLSDGYEPILRRQIALNLAERRLGSVQEPVRLVFVDRCVAERQELKEADARFRQIAQHVAALQAEYDSLPPSERESLGREIQRIQREQLTPASLALAVAKAARDACEKISPEPVDNGNPIRFIRDSLVIDEALISRVGENTGARIVFCAREVALAGLSPSHNVLVAADELKVEANAATSLVGSPSVTVLAARIDGVLQITSAGVPGEAGLDGEPGESGIIEDEAGGRPVIGPGGPGGPGGDGGAGTAGGTIKILYGSAAHTPTGSAPGGPGGPGGRGGAGGAGRPRGRPGSSGKPGAQGASGTVEIRQVGAQDLAGALDEESRKRWAAYRAEVEKATSSPV